MLEEVTETATSDSFLEVFAELSGEVSKNMGFFKEVLKSSQNTEECAACVCGDFICEGTDGQMTLKKLQELLGVNTELNITDTICNISTNSGFSSTMVALGLGAIAGASYLAYHHFLKNDVKPNEEKSVADNNPEKRAELKSPALTA